MQGPQDPTRNVREVVGFKVGKRSQDGRRAWGLVAGGGARRALARRMLARKCGEGVSGTDIWDSRSGDLRPHLERVSGATGGKPRHDCYVFALCCQHREPVTFVTALLLLRHSPATVTSMLSKKKCTSLVAKRPSA